MHFASVENKVQIFLFWLLQELGPWCAAATMHALLQQGTAAASTIDTSAAARAAAADAADDWLGLAAPPTMGLADAWCEPHTDSCAN